MSEREGRGTVPKRAYIVAVNPLDGEKFMVRPDIPAPHGAGGAFEGKRVMAYSSEEAVTLFQRGEDGFPEAPWPQSVTLTRPRGTTEARVANEPGLESETGGWEYQDYRRIDSGIIILMDDRRKYDLLTMSDANVVIDQHGKVIKHRTAVTTSEPMSAGPELLEQAIPRFPDPIRGMKADQLIVDEAADFEPLSQRYQLTTHVWTSLPWYTKLSVGLSVAALILSSVSLLLRYIG